MKKVFVLIYTWIVSLSLAALMIYGALEYYNITQNREQSFIASVDTYIKTHLVPSALQRGERVIPQPVASEFLQDVFLLRPQIMEMRLYNHNTELVSLVSRFSENPQGLKHRAEVLNNLIFYKNTSYFFQLEGSKYELQMLIPILSQDDVQKALGFSSVLLGTFALGALILLLTPEDKRKKIRKASSFSEEKKFSDPEMDISMEEDYPIPTLYSSTEPQAQQFEEIEVPRTKENDKLFSKTGLSHLWFLLPRLDDELSRCGSFSLDLSLGLLDGSELMDNNTRSKVAQKVIEHFVYKDMCFEGEDNRIWIMLPNQNLEMALKNMEKFLAAISASSLPSLSAGVASRSGRLMSGQRLCDECIQALEKAKVGMDRVVGFYADKEKFRSHLANN